jgi:hypothetical protein
MHEPITPYGADRSLPRWPLLVTALLVAISAGFLLAMAILQSRT